MVDAQLWGLVIWDTSTEHLHNITLLKRKRCSTSPKSAILMFLSVTSKAAFVCFKCHLRTLYLYSLTFRVVSMSLTINPTLWIFGPRASQYLFCIYCEVQVLKLKPYMGLIKVNWFLVQNGIYSHYIYCNAWVSVQPFPLTRHNSDLLHRAQGKPDFLFLIEYRQMLNKI